MSVLPTPHTRSIGGLPVVCTRAAELIALLAARRLERRPTELMFANTNFVMGCHGMASLLSGPETLIVNDGIGLDLASLFLHGSFFPENLAGSDFIPTLFDSLRDRTRVYLLGARREVVTAAAARWARLPHVEVVGVRDGYGDMEDRTALLQDLKTTAPDILLVALGDPLQARWIVAQRGLLDVPLIVAVGALFDFASGQVSRAPRWVRRLRLEWTYRLIREPRRLIRRYSIDLVAFFVHCMQARRLERRSERRSRRPA